MTPQTQQILTIARLELRRVFFSRRSFWIYILALFPAVIFFAHGIFEMRQKQRNQLLARTPATVLQQVEPGATSAQVRQMAGNPVDEFSFSVRRRNQPEEKRLHYTYYDGKQKWQFQFRDDKLNRIRRVPDLNLEEDRVVFANMFQLFFLRLAVFFGCLGIFMNLFRGEMLDKTLHFWFLVPSSRATLMLGKYLAGLVAAITVFCGGGALAFAMMLMPHDSPAVQGFLRDGGWSQFAWYLGAAALGCVGYGSAFTMAGLLFRNPLIPAISLLLWESIQSMLPAMLQRCSILFYLQSICPVQIPLDDDLPQVMRMLVQAAEPASPVGSVLGILAVSAVILWLASRAASRLEINYSTD